LDDNTTEQILTLLQRVNRELGMTLLMVTHDSDAASRATRQLRLERSELYENGKRLAPRVLRSA
jgi:putative ABC transport system ATP-binding protein